MNKLILINGKIDAGKDTVTKIIQMLTLKSNIEEILIPEMIELLTEGDNQYIDWWTDYQNKKFADTLKEAVAKLLGCKRDDLEDRNFKKQLLPESWSIMGMTHRDFLVKFGSALKKEIHPQLFIKALFRNYNPKKDSWIISDLRFEEEWDFAQQYNPITIQVVRNLRSIDSWLKLYHHIKILDWDGWDRTDLEASKNEKITLGEFKSKVLKSTIKSSNFEELFTLHKGETELENKDFHYTIYNNGTLEDLIKQVKIILNKIHETNT